MEGKYKRIFICQYENASEWVKNGTRLLSTFTDKDLFLVYRIAAGKGPANAKIYMDKLGEIAKITDVSMMGDEDRFKLICEDLKPLQSNDTFVYFLLDNDAYNFCLKENLAFFQMKSFMNLTQAVTVYNQENRKRQYQAKKSVQSNEKIEQIYGKRKKDSENNKKAETKEDFSKNSDAKKVVVKPEEKTEMVQSKDTDDGVSENDLKSEKNEKESDIESKHNNIKYDNNRQNSKINAAEEKRDKPIKQPKPNVKIVDTNNEETLGDMMTELAEENVSAAKKNEENGKEEKKKEEKKEERKGKRNDKKKEEEIIERTLEDIEKEIFGGEVKNDAIVRKYTKLDNYKAMTADETFQRLIKGIDKYISDDVSAKLERDDYSKFVITLLKSYNFEDFEESWKTLNLFEITLNEREFNYLKQEAEYYNNMCQLFYKMDKW